MWREGGKGRGRVTKQSMPKGKLTDQWRIIQIQYELSVCVCQPFHTQKQDAYSIQGRRSICLLLKFVRGKKLEEMIMNI